ncbi:MAG TPA: recombinase RecT [Gammaproteobacteria bacterium]|nr:recombinase RecT [Gammaproteobacteria bacterium]
MTEKKVWETAIAAAKPKFSELAASTGLNYGAEALYAYQACMKNNGLMKVAANNPVSLRMAMVNVAAVGLTLNPALGLAHLVPRDGIVCLDISYRGLIKIGSDCGSIRWAKAELVYSKDKFEYRGPATAPVHVFNPFNTDRGEFVGGYCISGIGEGAEVLVEVMAAEEIFKARDRSKAYQAHKGPWMDSEWPEEMKKKVIIKRAAKTWPRIGGRFGKAVEILNEVNGEGIVVDGECEAEAGGDAGGVPHEPVWDPEKASEATRARVSEVIRRAKAAGAWAAAEDYVKSQFMAHDRAYAEQALRKARAADKRDPADVEQPSASEA